MTLLFFLAVCRYTMISRSSSLSFSMDGFEPGECFMYAAIIVVRPSGVRMPKAIQQLCVSFMILPVL